LHFYRKERITMSRGAMMLIACPFAGQPLGGEISKLTGIPLVPVKADVFADGEMDAVIRQSVRDQDVFVIVQDDLTLGLSPAQRFDHIKDVIYSVCCAKARYLTVIYPSMYKARQHKANERKGIQGVRVAHELIAAGAQHLLTVDIHNSTSIGFFNGKGDNMSSFSPLHHAVMEYIGEMSQKAWIVSSIDANAGRAQYWANKLGIPLNIAWKERDYSKKNSVSRARVQTNVKGRNIILVDDMIDTAGSFEQVVKALRQAGAKRIIGVCTHSIFSGKAVAKLRKLHKELGLEVVIATNSVYHGEDFSKKNRWFRQVSLAPLIKETIVQIHAGLAVHEVYAD